MFVHPLEWRSNILFEVTKGFPARWSFLFLLPCFQIVLLGIFPMILSGSCHRGDWPLHQGDFSCSPFEELDMADHFFADLEHSSQVLKLPTVVGCREYSKYLSFVKKLIAFLDDLMWPAYEIELKLLQELVYDLLAENARDTSLEVGVPVISAIRWVWPEQVADHLILAVADRPFYLVDGL